MSVSLGAYDFTRLVRSSLSSAFNPCTTPTSLFFDRERINDFIHRNDTRLVVIGGIGRNPAHIAFNDFTEELASLPVEEKMNYALESKTRVVPLDDKTREANKRFFGNKIDLVPKYAVTIGFSEILHSDRVVIMATDESKRDSIKSIFAGKPSYTVPSSLK